MKIAAFVGGLLGLSLLVVLMVRADFSAIVHTLALAGLPLLWLVPYRGLFFGLYAAGWSSLLRPNDPARRAGPAYLFWVTTVREAIDRLLPVAGVGGGVAAVRLLRWRGVGGAAAGASIIAEILLTLIVTYVFTVLGLLLLIDLGASGREYRGIIIGLLLSLPVPILTALLLRYGALFGRMQAFLRPLVGGAASAVGGAAGAAALDGEVRATLRRGRSLGFAGSLQLLALVSGAFEVWFALRLFGHSIGFEAALVLESMTQAIRQVAFVVPAGLGVQEAGLVLFGHTLGIDGELALAVSMAKRLRELLWGVGSLLSCQWLEARRLRGLAQRPQ